MSKVKRQQYAIEQQRLTQDMQLQLMQFERQISSLKAELRLLQSSVADYQNLSQTIKI